MTGTTARTTSREIQEWRGWFGEGGKVFNDMVRLLMHRDMWRGTQAVLRDAEDLPNSQFWDYLVRTYVDSQVIAVRRLSDNTGDTQSLRRILEELKRKPQHVPLNEWTQHNGVSRVDWVRSFGEPVNGHLNPAYVGRLLDKLTTASEAVNHYANSYTAHASISPKVTGLRWDDLDTAIAAVWSAYGACDYIVTGSMLHYDDQVLGIAWDAVFDVPWRRPSA